GAGPREGAPRRRPDRRRRGRVRRAGGAVPRRPRGAGRRPRRAECEELTAAESALVCASRLNAVLTADLCPLTLCYNGYPRRLGPRILLGPRQKQAPAGRGGG